LSVLAALELLEPGSFSVDGSARFGGGRSPEPTNAEEDSDWGRFVAVRKKSFRKFAVCAFFI
jgi:hypothetical protein